MPCQPGGHEKDRSAAAGVTCEDEEHVLARRRNVGGGRCRAGYIAADHSGAVEHHSPLIKVQAVGGRAWAVQHHAIDRGHIGEGNGNAAVPVHVGGCPCDDGPWLAGEQVVGSPDLDTAVRGGLAARNQYLQQAIHKIPQPRITAFCWTDSGGTCRDCAGLPGCASFQITNALSGPDLHRFTHGIMSTFPCAWHSLEVFWQALTTRVWSSGRNQLKSCCLVSILRARHLISLDGTHRSIGCQQGDRVVQAGDLCVSNLAPALTNWLAGVINLQGTIRKCDGV